jgi:hypothetical protein
MKLLGLKVRDRVTRFEGVVSSVAFDLYGCVVAVVTPGLNEKDGKLEDGRWFDVKRLEILNSFPVMTPPTYAELGREIGAAEKPPM